MDQCPAHSQETDFLQNVKRFLFLELYKQTITFYTMEFKKNLNVHYRKCLFKDVNMHLRALQ